jgi:hypothetical protein
MQKFRGVAGVAQDEQTADGDFSAGINGGFQISNGKNTGRENARPKSNTEPMGRILVGDGASKAWFSRAGKLVGSNIKPLSASNPKPHTQTNPTPFSQQRRR